MSTSMSTVRCPWARMVSASSASGSNDGLNGLRDGSPGWCDTNFPPAIGCPGQGRHYATRMRSIATALLLVGLAAMIAASGCGGGDSSANDSHSVMRSDKGIGAPGAKVDFVTPKEASANSSTVVVKVKLKRFKLAPKKVGEAAKKGEGHLHFAMDQGKFDHPKYSGPNGKTAVKIGAEGEYSPSTTRTIVYKHLPPGTHELQVYLANNDHTNTGVDNFVSFFVKTGTGAPPPPAGGSGGGSGY